jgi:hypothetical protein
MITFQCSCGQKMSAREEFAGRMAKCRNCGSTVTIPAHGRPPQSEAVSEPAPTPDPPTRVKKVKATPDHVATCLVESVQNIGTADAVELVEKSGAAPTLVDVELKYLHVAAIELAVHSSIDSTSKRDRILDAFHRRLDRWARRRASGQFDFATCLLRSGSYVQQAKSRMAPNMAPVLEKLGFGVIGLFSEYCGISADNILLLWLIEQRFSTHLIETTKFLKRICIVETI